MHVARAFGHACRHLEWSTSASDPADWAREDDFLVEWCRSAPNLVHLDASSYVSINMERAAAIGSACPLLEEVKFCGFDADDEDVCLGPAESWAKCFPKLRQVHLSPYAWNEHSPPAFVPTDLAAISETLRVCASAVVFFFFKQKTAYEISLGLVGSEMCIRDRSLRVLKCP